MCEIFGKSTREYPKRVVLDEQHASIQLYSDHLFSFISNCSNKDRGIEWCLKNYGSRQISASRTGVSES